MRFIKTKKAQQSFELYCKKEKSWLDDFALFQLVKTKQENKPWYQWPDDLLHRDQEALDEMIAENNQELKRIKWYQYIFSKQWAELKAYCNNRGIKLIGDMPFYVSYDSADVWAAQHLFSLNEEGQQTGVAGVPPDAFSADGQLWGMPTFNWQTMKEEGHIFIYIS